MPTVFSRKRGGSGMRGVQVRPAEAQDLDALVRIYNHYVLSSHVTFDTETVSVDARRPWFEGFSERGPHQLLVAEQAGRVLGYASSTRHRPKRGYDRSVETTIYVDRDAVERGIGRQLYGALLERLKAEPDVHRAFGGIALPNPASIALHERLGFRFIGTFHDIGFKFDRYWDVSWYEKDLSAAKEHHLSMG